MPEFGVNIAIIEYGKVLLTLREDFEVWCLPGGSVDGGESLAEAALREAREETGLDVALTRFVGAYSRPNWLAGGSHAIVFAARPVGGSLRANPREVLQIRYFAAVELPDMLLFGHRQRILDALNGVRGAVWSQEDEWPFGKDISRADLYRLRDQSGLTRYEFYLKYFGQRGAEERLEVPPVLPSSG